MTSIVSYRKAYDAHTTYTLATPDSQDDNLRCTELCTLDGTTYVAVPDGVTLPEQPPEIADSVQTVTLTPELREAICAASPHVALINARVRAAIAERYSMSDEIKLIRTAPSQEFDAYNAYVEDCRAWGRAQRAALGL